eukprot:14886996-Alexandrium_andersonii.AAC.1
MPTAFKPARSTLPTTGSTMALPSRLMACAAEAARHWTKPGGAPIALATSSLSTYRPRAVSYTHLRAHETSAHL